MRGLRVRRKFELCKQKKYQGFEPKCQEKKKANQLTNYDKWITTSMLISQEEGECLVL